MRRRSISYLINADVFQWKYWSDTGHRWISNPHNIHKLYISSISSSSRTAPSARSKFSSSSRVKGSARSNSIISSFEQGRPVRCSTRTRLDSTRKPSLIPGRSCAVWPANNSEMISGQNGLQIIVMNRPGLPQYRTIAIATWHSCHISRGPPLNDEGMMLPTSIPCRAASTMPRYTSDRSFSWLRRR